MTENVSLLVSVVEAAEMLSISRNLAYEMIRQGRIPHVRLGRRVLVSRAGLEQWLARETGLGVGQDSGVSLTVQHQGKEEGT